MDERHSGIQRNPLLANFYFPSRAPIHFPSDFLPAAPGRLFGIVLGSLGLATVKKTIPVPRIGETRSVVDLDMLQQVITHRYDVMTRYVKSLQQVYSEELARLRSAHGVDARKLRAALLADAQTLSANAREQLAEALAHSPKLAQLHAMREELAALWARSSFTSEQLLKHLQDWCHRAEASGVRQLQELSLRMRSYAA